MNNQTKQLRSKAKHLNPILQIGKNGLAQGSIDLVDRELEHKHLIKIKLLKAALPEDASTQDRRVLASTLAAKTKAQLIEQVGNVVVLYRSQ